MKHDSDRPDAAQGKKAYKAPVLQKYGNVRAMTHSTGMLTFDDSSGMITGNTKTA